MGGSLQDAAARCGTVFRGFHVTPGRPFCPFGLQPANFRGAQLGQVVVVRTRHDDQETFGFQCLTGRNVQQVPSIVNDREAARIKISREQGSPL